MKKQEKKKKKKRVERVKKGDMVRIFFKNEKKSC